MLRRRAMVAGITTAIAALALAATPAAAAPADPAAQADSLAQAAAAKPPPGVISAMQRDLGLNAEQAATRLLNEGRASRTEPTLRKKIKGDFAGSWLTGKTGTLVVATVDPADTATITKAGAQAKVVQRSLRDLTKVKEGLDAAAEHASVEAPVWYVDVQSNSVVVLAQDTAAGDAFVAASGVDTSAVRVVKSDEQPKAYNDVRGGDAYYIGPYRCSVGFSVTRGSTPGFVTAGHCGDVGNTTQGFNRVAQGTFEGSSFPGNDYAWVSVNSQWTPRGVVNGYSAGEIAVAGSQEQIEGASVCRSGSTTQWRCGTIQQRNTSVTYPEGTITGVTRTSACAEGGDSGGSYISGNQAQGVTSGGSGNCSVGGTTYFQPVNEILSVYGLTLVTNTGNPPPQGCANYQNQYNGSLTANQNVYQPTGGSYTTTVSGTHAACLDGPAGVDFDLYLQRLNGNTWTTVATSNSPNPDETISYNGAPGTYRYRVHAYSGSGTYTLGINRP
ncbi:streptogrisin C [Sinosporangium album]|uniref:Streptogrisin C n=1 Tax=Sinosporangium album TaxID=504805 RepID=A0A1G7SDU7_9ACTN|nr:S1 family peptidase [Sinosporangium album]SDG20380.1 streptogrisin C [Sinosporangium album]